MMKQATNGIVNNKFQEPLTKPIHNLLSLEYANISLSPKFKATKGTPG